MIRFRSILFGGVLVLALGGISFAQDFTPRVGVAGNISVNLPVLGLRTWFTQAPQFGVNIVYHRHARIEVEYEYHHARFDGGSLEDAEFMWAPTGTTDLQSYKSPNAQSRMRFHSFLVNGVFFFGKQLNDQKARPYFTFGSGMYHYRTTETGLIFPGQTGNSLNTSIVLESDGDVRTTVGINFGLGVAFYTSDRFALDLRGRYHIIIGQLRPMEAWGLKQVFPFHALDLGIRVKTYF